MIELDEPRAAISELRLVPQAAPRADSPREQTAARASQPSDPLAPILALSAEEKIALFS
jgi:hypothetical protein